MLIETADDIEVALYDGRKFEAVIIGPRSRSRISRSCASRPETRCHRSPSHRAIHLRSAMWCWQSATRSALARPSPWASSRHSGARTWASTPSRISSRPMQRSIPAYNSGGALVDARQSRRSQRRDLLAFRRIAGHRFCDSGFLWLRIIMGTDISTGSMVQGLNQRKSGNHAQGWRSFGMPGVERRADRGRGPRQSGRRAGIRPGDILLAIDATSPDARTYSRRSSGWRRAASSFTCAARAGHRPRRSEIGRRPPRSSRASKRLATGGQPCRIWPAGAQRGRPFVRQDLLLRRHRQQAGPWPARDASGFNDARQGPLAYCCFRYRTRRRSSSRSFLRRTSAVVESAS